MSKFIRVVLSIIVLTFFIPPLSASANNGSLNGVHSEAVINIDGTVDIEQIWVYDDTKVTDGSEHYIDLNVAYKNGDVRSGVETISDYTVYHNGNEMEFDSDWNVNDSFEQKAGKYGVVVLSDNRLELTFGITEKAVNEYKVQYKVHNVVKETTDGHKFLHWTFLPTDLSPSPRELTAEIHVTDGLEIEKVYGFQFDGTVGFLGEGQSKVFAEMEGLYRKNNTLNMFALLSDESNLLKNTTKINSTIDERAEEMLEGSDYDLNHFHSNHIDKSLESVNGASTFSIKGLFGLLKGFFTVGNIPLVFFMFILFRIFSSNPPSRTLIENMSREEIVKLKREKDFYYRDEPDEVADAMEVIRVTMGVREMNNNIVSYFVSKWTSDGVFESLGEIERSVLFFKPEKVTLFQIDETKLKTESELERSVFREFHSMSNNENVVSTGDLRNLDIDYIMNAIKDYKKTSFSNLEEKGYVEYLESDGKSLFNTKKKRLVLTNEGVELIFQHAGMKNFLTQFTLIEERGISEIELWDYYFHMAALYGVAEAFKKELREIPNLSEQDIDRYNKHYGNSATSLLSREIGSAFSSAYNSHNSHSFSSSSSGGGGGSSGGGSGGGTR